MESIEAKLDPQRLKHLRLLAQCVRQLRGVEKGYFNQQHRDWVLARDQLHPICLQLDSGSIGAKEDGQFVHPVNYFLQQEAMTQLWAKRSGLSMSGAGGAAPAGGGAAAAVQEEVVAEPEAFFGLI